MGEQRAPGFGQFRLLRSRTLEHSDAELFLEIVDPVSDGGSGAVQVAPGACEAAALDHRGQNLELVERGGTNLHFEKPEKRILYYPYFLK